MAPVDRRTPRSPRPRAALPQPRGDAAALRECTRIARDLHDGPLQTLVGAILLLETCKQLVGGGCTIESLAALTELRAALGAEYETLHAYVGALDDARVARPIDGATGDTWVTVRADFAGPIGVVDHAVQMMRAAVANIRRHAQAGSAAIDVRGDGPVVVKLDDDGVGLQRDAPLPWSISSRVRELGGNIERAESAGSERPGTHLVLTLGPAPLARARRES